MTMTATTRRIAIAFLAAAALIGALAASQAATPATPGHTVGQDQMYYHG
jgi:hypothetical protein